MHRYNIQHKILGYLLKVKEEELRSLHPQQSADPYTLGDDIPGIAKALKFQEDQVASAVTILEGKGLIEYEGDGNDDSPNLYIITDRGKYFYHADFYPDEYEKRIRTKWEFRITIMSISLAIISISYNIYDSISDKKTNRRLDSLERNDSLSLEKHQANSIKLQMMNNRIDSLETKLIHKVLPLDTSQKKQIIPIQQAN